MFRFSKLEKRNLLDKIFTSYIIIINNEEEDTKGFNIFEKS